MKSFLNSHLLVILSLSWICTACDGHFSSGLNDSQQNSDIVNGMLEDGSDIWASSVVGLATKNSNDGTYFIYCTGSLLTNNVVVTGAHCLATVVGDNYVVFGLKEGSANLEAHKFVKSVIHEKFNINSFNQHAYDVSVHDVFDIALVQFEGDLPAKYHPAQLLPDLSLIKNGDNILLVGYGITNARTQEGGGILRFTEVPVKDAAYGPTELLTDETKNGSCDGDSGGPGFVLLNGKLYLWGITSRGDANCTDHGVYTKILAYKTWVDDKLKAWTPAPTKCVTRQCR